MMKDKTEILVVGTNEPILATVLRLLGKNDDWNATGVSSVEEAVEQCGDTVFDVLLIGAGLTDGQEAELSKRVQEIYPQIHVVPHYGGGSGLLFAEIYLALAGGTKNQAQ